MTSIPAPVTAWSGRHPIVRHHPLQWRRTQLLFSQWRYGIGVQLLSALLMVALLWQLADAWLLLGWLGLMASQLCARWLWMTRFRTHARSDDGNAWVPGFLLLTVASGLLWSGLAIVTYDGNPPAMRGFLALWIAGLAAGSVASHSAVITAHLAFSVPALLPYAIRLMLAPENLEKTLGAGLLLLLGFLYLVARQVNRSLVSSINLEFENNELIDRLNGEKAKTDSLVQQLRVELQERERTEQELRASRDSARQLADELRQLSSRDGLTGIANRRHFEEILEREWNRCLRTHQSLALIIGDIDFFKNYNDHYGHTAGDNCIRKVAELFAAQARRHGDLAARYGGEEFVLLLPDSTREHAAGVAEQLRQDIAELALVHDYSVAAPVVTVSLGVASLMPALGRDSAELVNSADTALYQAKAAGRNQVVTA